MADPSDLGHGKKTFRPLEVLLKVFLETLCVQYSDQYNVTRQGGKSFLKVEPFSQATWRLLQYTIYSTV